MIVVDTNVLSEAIKPFPSEHVIRWFAAQELQALFTTTITQAEIFSRIELMPAGRRKDQLSEAIDRVFSRAFMGRILHFDEESAHLYAKIVSARKRIGRPILQFDAMIAAISRANGATLATRNTSDFEHCGIELVNPWEE